MILLVGLIFSCKPKIGVHEVVEFDGNYETSDQIYIDFLSDQIERHPDEADNYVKLASVYTRQNNNTKAISLLQRGENENPNDTGILIQLAELYLRNEDQENLSTTLRKIRNLDPDNMDFLKLSAGYSLLLKDYTNAIFFANRAILENPYDDENYYLRGGAQLINNDSLNALISLKEAYRLKHSLTNFAGVFDVALATGVLDEAKAYLDEFATNHPDDQLCYYWGAYYRSAGDLDTSKYLLQRCLENTTEPRIDLELARIYYRNNNTDSTLFYINKYLETNPLGTEGHVLKANTLERISYYTEARNLYKTALEIDSTSTLARRGLENLERKVAYLRLVKRKEQVQQQVETLKPLNSKEIN